LTATVLRDTRRRRCVLVELERADLREVGRLVESLREVESAVLVCWRRRERHGVREGRVRVAVEIGRANAVAVLSVSVAVVVVRTALLVSKVEATESSRSATAAVLAIRDLEVLVVRVLLDALDGLDLRDGGRVSGRARA
jgi:hypothetical protein